LERFRALLAKAALVSELDGSRKRGGEPYAHVGEQIVEQSDFLLVVWDGLPPRGPGGTGDTVQRALDHGVPVAVLPHAGPATAVLHGKGAQDIAALVQAALLPAPDPSGFPRTYFEETPKNTGWAGFAVRWFERTMLMGARVPPPPRGAIVLDA